VRAMSSHVSKDCVAGTAWCASNALYADDRVCLQGSYGFVLYAGLKHAERH
jgi:hypothetical protein